jgi:hypothetical protein
VAWSLSSERRSFTIDRARLEPGNPVFPIS